MKVLKTNEKVGRGSLAGTPPVPGSKACVRWLVGGVVLQAKTCDWAEKEERGE